jgi:hypothetical protein
MGCIPHTIAFWPGAGAGHLADGFAKAAQGKGEEHAANCNQRRRGRSHISNLLVDVLGLRRQSEDPTSLLK